MDSQLPTRIKALLLDLDNTLLRNDMATFVPAYLSALADFMADYFPPDMLITHLMRATRAMMNDTDPSRTNLEAFDRVFFPALGRTRRELEPVFERFYATRFPQLRSLTRSDPIARPLVAWAFEQGFRVAVATNPLFPRTAIEQRLEWAGVPSSEFPYHLITSYEDMHATKPHPAYYLEIAQRLDCRPEECLMVGDDWEMDILPALEIGMETYWIAQPEEEPRSEGRGPLGVGSLADFYHWIRDLSSCST